QSSRFSRTFCMRSCEDNSDRRDGYQCIDMSASNNPWAASVGDYGADGHVCAVPFVGSRPAPDRSTGVCTGYQGNFELPDASTHRDSGTESDSGTELDAQD